MEFKMLHWVIFGLIIFGLLYFDLTFVHKNNHKISFRKNVYISLFYIFISLVFAVYLYFDSGKEAAELYLTGYAIEKSLSLDNIFLIAIIFQHFSIPSDYQQRILFWGILGAIILRGVLIGLGVIIIEKFSWILYLFSLFLILTGFKLFFQKKKQVDYSNNFILKVLSKIIPFSSKIEGEKFFVKVDENLIAQNKSFIKKYASTPLFLALVLVELTDLVFALDSIPAIFSITTEPYIVYTSNIFAILGLRSLFFVLQKMVETFEYLKYSLASLLIFIGSKIFIKEFIPFIQLDSSITLFITLLILVAGIVPSFLKKTKL